MTRKRTVFVAGAISALLLSASAMFAVSSGLFGSGRAEQVGTFQAIEQRIRPTSVPATSAPGSPARTLTPPQSASATSSPPSSSDVTASSAPISYGSTSSTTARREPDENSEPEPSVTSTSDPEHREDDLNDGRESDD
jgi:hypothetical protein